MHCSVNERTRHIVCNPPYTTREKKINIQQIINRIFAIRINLVPQLSTKK